MINAQDNNRPSNLQQQAKILGRAVTVSWHLMSIEDFWRTNGTEDELVFVTMTQRLVDDFGEQGLKRLAYLTGKAEAMRMVSAAAATHEVFRYGEVFAQRLLASRFYRTISVAASNITVLQAVQATYRFLLAADGIDQINPPFIQIETDDVYVSGIAQRIGIRHRFPTSELDSWAMKELVPCLEGTSINDLKTLS